jgi:hypothetical protein
MDILSFEKNKSFISIFYKNIGEYTLEVYLGKWGITCSDPTDFNLPFDKYKVVGVILENKFKVAYQSLSSIGISDIDDIYSKNGKGYEKNCYNLTIQELERVYNKLNELAGIVSQSNKNEKPCKKCGKMNDVGVSYCWSFNCGVKNPTE